MLLIEHPELGELGAREATDDESMFAIAAAREMAERREALVAALERSGALVVRTTGAQLAGDAIRKYLEIKRRGLL